MLQQAIATAQQNNERKLVTEIKVPRPELDTEQRRRIESFRKFCTTRGVQAIPAAPATVAAFVETQNNEVALQALEAIAAAHDYYGLANPCATYSVRVILERRLRIDCPRSWDMADRLVFASLDPIVRSIIFKREDQRDKALRRKQNELAEEKKRLSDSAEAKPVIDKEQLSL